MRIPLPLALLISAVFSLGVAFLPPAAHAKDVVIAPKAGECLKSAFIEDNMQKSGADLAFKFEGESLDALHRQIQAKLGPDWKPFDGESKVDVFGAKPGSNDLVLFVFVKDCLRDATPIHRETINILTGAAKI
jgi:hypothetical protein